MSLETWQDCNLERLYEEFLEEGHPNQFVEVLDNLCINFYHHKYFPVNYLRG